MAIANENGNGMVMPVAPMYGGGYGNMGGIASYGGDALLWIIIVLCLGGGWGGFGGFGMGGAMMGAGMMDGMMLYPWMNQAEITTQGFQNQQLSNQIGNIQNAITTGFGDTALGIAGINQAICQTGNGITQQLYNNEIASLNRSFAEQTANAQDFNGVQAGIADLRYTEATENCATRTAAYQNTRDIIDSQTRGTQAILDKLCALELDGVKSQLAQAQRENVGLQNQVNMATMQASQVAQTAQIIAGQNAATNSLVTELRSCPIPSQPVYGNTPIFSCSGNNSGCGCNGFN